VNAHNAREQAALERAVWEAEHPEEAAKQQAEVATRQAELRAMMEVCVDFGVLERHKRIDTLKARADRCAKCNKPFDAGDVIYRRGAGDSPVLPYCVEHACGQPNGRHNKDAPDGSYYPSCRCPNGLAHDRKADAHGLSQLAL